MKIFVDFDGTVLDASSRMHGLFRDLVPDSRLGRDDYWRLKRSGLKHADILRDQHGYDEARLREFEDRWMPRIESAEWLALDEVSSGAHEALRQLSKLAELYLLTARQREDAVLSQLERFDLSRFFAGVLVTGPTRTKHDLLLKFPSEGPGDWVVGDTEADIALGRRSGKFSAAVTGGFRDASFLERSAPDLLCADLLDFSWRLKERLERASP